MYLDAKELSEKSTFLQESFRFAMNMFVILFYECSMIMQKIVFNYFGGFIVIFVVMAGNYYRNIGLNSYENADS